MEGNPASAGRPFGDYLDDHLKSVIKGSVDVTEKLRYFQQSFTISKICFQNDLPSRTQKVAKICIRIELAVKIYP